MPRKSSPAEVDLAVAYRAGEFYDYMLERHVMYLRRQRGEPEPWSSDPVMQRAYLTNVYRELDKVTVWVRENIREPYAKHPNLWHALCIARLINVPETLQELINEGALISPTYRAGPLTEVLQRRMSEGKATYTQAYMTWGGIVRGQPKHVLFGEIFQRLWNAREEIEPRLHGTLQEAWETLNAQYGLGGFLAYEVVSDLRHTRYLSTARDVKSWAHAGPGAKRGLNWVFDRKPVERPVNNEQALAEMRALLQHFSLTWPFDPALEMREVEHSLCEFSKVCALRYDGKRPKRWYRKGAA